MSRKVKLITEWATWTLVKFGTGVNYALKGEIDFAAVAERNSEGQWYFSVYIEHVRADVGWYYNEGTFWTVPGTMSEGEALLRAEEKLVEIGLIDFMWWVTQ